MHTIIDPDLAPIVLSEEYIANLKASLPELPHIRKQRYINDFSLPEYDAEQLTISKETANYFEKVNSICNNPKAVANWIMTDFTKLLNEAEITISESKITAENLAELILLIDKGTISSAIAKKVFKKMFETGKSAKQIVEEEGLVQVTDENEIKQIVFKSSVCSRL